MDLLVVALFLPRLCLSACTTSHSGRITSITTDCLFLSDDTFANLNVGGNADAFGGAISLTSTSIWVSINDTAFHECSAEPDDPEQYFGCGGACSLSCSPSLRPAW
jgi:hypothetical protein